MALDISLAQFNRIASGDYNAGQIDIKVGDNGQAELVKINNHVWRKEQRNALARAHPRGEGGVHQRA